MPELHFEDFPVGWTVRHGPRLVTREEILAFAAEFDPQPFHLDEDAARASLLGGLAASGWHACAVMMRLMFEAFIGACDSHGAPGIDEVQWLKPLRPGARVSLAGEVLEARTSKSRPEIGLVRFRCELLDEAGDVLVRQVHTQMIGRRAAEAS